MVRIHNCSPFSAAGKFAEMIFAVGYCGNMLQLDLGVGAYWESGKRDPWVIVGTADSLGAD